MCGIVYAHDFNKSPVNKWVVEQFNRQRLRGTEGFGVFDGQFKHIVRSAKERKLTGWLEKYPSNILMFHHRTPTSTINVARAAHPFSTKNYFGDNQYIMIHNGWVNNSFDLKKVHEALGMPYQSVLIDGTFNDSEALLWDLANFIEGRQDDVEAEGAIAFTMVKLVHGELDKLYFGRNTSPLHMSFTGNRLQLSSEGDGGLIQADTLYEFDYKDNSLRTRWVAMPTGYHAYRGPYKATDWDGPITDDLADMIEAEIIEGRSEGTSLVGFRAQGSQVAPKARTSGQTTLALPAPKLRHQLAQDDLNTLYLAYLLENKGHFESAYWSMEADLLVLEEQRKESPGSLYTASSIYQLEQVMAMLEHDPENRSAISVSSKVDPSWAQNNMKG